MQRLVAAPAGSVAPCAACDAAREFQPWEGFSREFNTLRREMHEGGRKDKLWTVDELVKCAAIAENGGGLADALEMQYVRCLALEALCTQVLRTNWSPELMSILGPVADSFAYSPSMALRLAAASAFGMSQDQSERLWQWDASGLIARRLEDLVDDEHPWVRAMASAAGGS